MATLQSAFPGDTLIVWDDYDYSDPNTTHVGHFLVGDEVEILERKFLGILVQWANGRTGWVCEWNVVGE
jgi:hypothetical protein